MSTDWYMLPTMTTITSDGVEESTMNIPIPTVSNEVRKQLRAIRNARCACRLTRRSKAGDVVLVQYEGRTQVFYVICWDRHIVMLRSQDGFITTIVFSEKGRLVV